MKRYLFLLIFVVFLLASCDKKIEISDDKHDILEHEFNQIEILKEATCTEEGIKKLSCTCGASIEEKIAIKQHSFEWKTEKEATCTETGIKKGTCSYCSFESTQLLEATGHSYIWETTKEATCTEEGITEGKCSCGDVITQTLEMKEHIFEEATMVKVSATTEKEGYYSNMCFNCDKEEKIIIMKTPSVTRNLATLFWEKIEGADGYNVYIDNKLYADLGNVLSFDVPLNANKEYWISVEAYSNNPDYYQISTKSKPTVVKVENDNTNLQENCGTDFQGFKDELEPIQSLIKDAPITKYYGNFSNGSVEVIKSKDNSYAKLKPLNNIDKAAITYSADPKILEAGTYVISMDVKLSSEANGTLSFKIFAGSETAKGTWIEFDNAQFDISNANSSEWTKVSLEYKIDETVTCDYANVDIIYQSASANENNFILIDNIKFDKFVNSDTKKSVFTGRNSGFESFYYDGLLDSLDWHSDGTTDVVLVSKGSIYNSLILENDGNVAFKAYSTNTIASIVSFKASTEIANAGVYKMTMKVKLGPNATNEGPIGFRMFASSWIGVFDTYFTDLSEINGNTWTTIETYFVVPKTVAVTYNTMEMFFYTNNYPNPSEENYLLIDDIEVYRVNVS